MSYSLVYRRVEIGEVPSERDESGVITMVRRDLKLLEKRPKADTKWHAITVRPELDQYAAWEREARRRVLAVSALAMLLMDDASWGRGETPRRRCQRLHLLDDQPRQERRRKGDDH